MSVSKDHRAFLDTVKAAGARKRHRTAVCRKIRQSGQGATFTFMPQAGSFSHPARVVDPDTRALINAALAARRHQPSRM